MHKRIWVDILAEMVEAAKEPIGKTALMYKLSFSGEMFKHYILLAQNNGVLEYDPERRRFRTTEKGREYLNVYHNLNQLIQNKEISDYIIG